MSRRRFRSAAGLATTVLLLGAGGCGDADSADPPACEPGYQDDATGICVPIDPCDPNPCVEANRTVCTPSGATAACTCDVGYVDGGSGTCVTSTFAQVQQWVNEYKAANPGNGGKDWDINAKTPAEVASDPAAQQLLAVCGADQRPVIPLLAWEYGGSDHPWINPEASALVYCVYTPVVPSTANWSYDDVLDDVTADLYVKFPDENPCSDEVGRDQVASCIGDPSNFEVLVDIASYHDGVEVGLSLSEASTTLMLIQSDGTEVELIQAS